MPAAADLEAQYEQFGTNVSRSNRFSDLRRKQLTLEMIEGERILEIGSAEGWMTEGLVSKAETVVSCDIAMNYLKRAQENGMDAKFFRVDSHCLPFVDKYFDCVVMTEVLEHLYSPYRALEEIHRVLKPGGHLVISVPNVLSLSNIARHILRKNSRKLNAHLSVYDFFGLKQLLGFTGFDVHKARTSFFYFPGLSPLFQSHVLQRMICAANQYFGDKLIIKAVKTDWTLWKELG
jgi:2-polyprenyl-3-methyl-5-hydroxy-6-metoxy-1,4-benzoquinol methylase